MKAFIIYSDYTNREGETIIELYGRLENGQSFVTLNKIRPYFFIKQKDLKKISRYLAKFKTEKSSFKNFAEEPVLKISAKNQTDLNNLYDTIRKKVETYEADIKPHQRFLMDLDIKGSIEISGDYESSEKVDRIYTQPEITPAQFKPNLKIASIDIETSSDPNQIMCIGIHSQDSTQNFFVTDQKLKNSISCKSEADCLEKFKSAILELDPDIITGWNVIDFDLKYLQSRFHANKIPFDLGRNNSEVRIRIQSNFFRSSTAQIPGRQVLDALNLIRDPFIKEAPTIKKAEFESYTLEDVAQALLDKGKLIKGSGRERHALIEKYYSSGQKGQQKVVDYNILDCILALDILKETKTLDLAIERSQLTGMPLDKITGSIAAFDSLYIREAHKKDIVSPTLRYGLKEERITGGYVQESTPGIYNNVLVLDFKSLYPSIIKTFNIDPASQLDKKTHNSIESPNKAYFKNQPGVLPEIISRLHEAREKAKKEKRELSSYAIKIIMNSFFGVLASPSCRYFNLDMANSITHFGQFIIKLTAQQIESQNPKVKVIYSDTDSVFVNSGMPKAKAQSFGKEIQEDINKFYNSYVKKNYSRESFLELEFEKLYLSLLMPSIRGAQEKGAKKRYAGLLEKPGGGKPVEVMEIVGLEAIRGDWTEAAQEFQVSLLNKVFHKKPIVSYIRSYIKELQSGALDKKLIYKKSIRKDLKEYTKTTPPHVKAARKLEKLDSKIIQYYITTDGPEPIQKHSHKIDYDHYIKKQIQPIAQQVLILLGKDFDDVTKSSKQAKLF